MTKYRASQNSKSFKQLKGSCYQIHDFFYLGNQRFLSLHVYVGRES